jgi:23S rRNA (guanosine2251-2'-O)-methyltransferase
MPAHSIPHLRLVFCSSPNCQLRFPLDTVQFKAHFCPRCGSPLRIDEEVTSSVLPPKLDLSDGLVLAGFLDNIRSAHNVGTIFRSAEGLGLSHLYLGGITPTPASTRSVAKSALGAEKRLPWSYHPNGPIVMDSLIQESWQIFALEVITGAKPLPSLPKPERNSKILLVVGNEPSGLDPKILSCAHQVISLPMAGEKHSFNVAVAFSIAVAWLRYQC